MHFHILMATLNAGKVLGRCLRSIERQRYPDIEILIQDGGSTDATLQIIRRFAHSGLPIHWRSEPDRGIYDALNKALPDIRSGLVVILGADDELMPGALSVVADATERRPADIYPGKALFVHPDGWQAVCKVDPCDKRSLLLHMPFCHNAMFARREAYEAIGPFNLRYRLASDAEWVHRAINKNLRFEPVDMVLSRFYAGGSSSDPALVMEEAYRLVQDEFPCLKPEDARYLLHMGKGWEGPNKLEEILSRYPQESSLADTARLAATYAPQSAQRDLDRAAALFASNKKTSGISKRLWNKLMRMVRT